MRQLGSFNEHIQGGETDYITCMLIGKFFLFFSLKTGELQ